MRRNKNIKNICIVKRRGHCENFDERKVYGSCYFACRSAHLSEKEAERISNRICIAVRKWIKGKKEVMSDELFLFLVKELKKYNDDSSFLYETHRDIS